MVEKIPAENILGGMQQDRTRQNKEPNSLHFEEKKLKYPMVQHFLPHHLAMHV